MSLAEFTVTSKCALAQVVKLPVCELNHRGHTEPPTRHDCDTVAAGVARVVSAQVANALPPWIAEKSMVIVTRNLGEFGEVTVTLLLIVHDTAALQLAPNLIFSTGTTNAPGSTAPAIACTSMCRVAKASAIVAALSSVTAKEKRLVSLTPSMRISRYGLAVAM
jgi:hypothetical protein